MDTTHRLDQPRDDDRELAALADVDPADAPDLAESLAARLAAELEATGSDVYDGPERGT